MTNKNVVHPDSDIYHSCVKGKLLFFIIGDNKMREFAEARDVSSSVKSRMFEIKDQIPLIHCGSLEYLVASNRRMLKDYWDRHGVIHAD